MTDSGLSKRQRDLPPADRSAVEELRHYVAAHPANGTLLLTDASRARAIISDAAPGDKALRNALISLVDPDLRAARILQSQTVTAQALAVLSARLQEQQGISASAAERAVTVLAAVFAPQIEVSGQPPEADPPPVYQPPRDQPQPWPQPRPPPTHVHPSFPPVGQPQHFPPTPRPRSKRPLALGALAAVVAAALVVTVVLVTTSNSPTHPAAQTYTCAGGTVVAHASDCPSGPTPSRTCPDGTVVAAAGVCPTPDGLSPAERALVDDNPDPRRVDASSCKSDSDPVTGEDVGVVCSPAFGSVISTIYLRQFTSAQSLADFEATGFTSLSQGSCDGSAPRQNQWNRGGQTPNEGLLFCFTTSDNLSRVAWDYSLGTNSGAFLFMYATGVSGASLASVMDWWRS